MKLVFFSSVLNHHQVGVADELYGILGDEYNFVELTSCNDLKGGSDDYGTRPYIVKAWQSDDAYYNAMQLAKTAEVCVFSGCESLPFERERLSLGLLSFDMGERMLKRGWLNLLSPRIVRLLIYYHRYGWKNKPLYKLCCSAFTAPDCKKLGMFRDRCYKWGYFTDVDNDYNLLDVSDGTVSMMWCARFLTCKHPELVVEMALALKRKGYRFTIDIFGDEMNVARHEKTFPKVELERLIKSNHLEDIISLKGSIPNKAVIEEMRRHQIFLFTSDRKEGWGAVANEAMANGCLLVASDAIGSAPYLINDGYNGFVFKNCKSDSLCVKVEWLLNHPQECKQARLNAVRTMRTIWNPRNAAISLLKLIGNLERGLDTDLKTGPCSKA